MPGLYVPACRRVQRYFGNPILNTCVCLPLSHLNLGFRKRLLNWSPTSLQVKVWKSPSVRKGKATCVRHMGAVIWWGWTRLPASIATSLRSLVAQQPLFPFQKLKRWSRKSNILVVSWHLVDGPLRFAMGMPVI